MKSLSKKKKSYIIFEGSRKNVFNDKNENTLTIIILNVI